LESNINKGKVQQVSWDYFYRLCDEVIGEIIKSDEMFNYIYAVPRGGFYVAEYLSNRLNIPLSSLNSINPTSNILIVDDICDTGRTLEKVYNYIDNLSLHSIVRTVVLFKSSYSKFNPNYVGAIKREEWIQFPYEKENNNETVENNIVRLLEYIGENPNREGLVDTPNRVVKSYNEIFSGYKDNNDYAKLFDAKGYKGFILLKDIELYSTCEHHLLPFTGKCHICYIPNEKVIGISKLVKIMEKYARRVQIQEVLTFQIIEELNKILKPKGIVVMIEAQHWCIRSRGVKKQNSVMVTSEVRGMFRHLPALELKFLQMIKS